jgi:hypothetical protein
VWEKPIRPPKCLNFEGPPLNCVQGMLSDAPFCLVATVFCWKAGRTAAGSSLLPSECQAMFETDLAGRPFAKPLLTGCFLLRTPRSSLFFTKVGPYRNPTRMFKLRSSRSQVRSFKRPQVREVRPRSQSAVNGQPVKTRNVMPAGTTRLIHTGNLGNSGERRYDHRSKYANAVQK